MITNSPDILRAPTVYECCKNTIWPVDSIFVLPGVITPLCLLTQSQRVWALGHMLLTGQLPRTHWVMICMIRRLALSFRRLLKTRLFSEYWYTQRIRGIALCAQYFLTYLQYFISTHLKLANLYKVPNNSQPDYLPTQPDLCSVFHGVARQRNVISLKQHPTSHDGLY